MRPKLPHSSAARSPIMEADAFISSPEASFMPGFTSIDPRLAHIPSLLFDLSLLREKIHQVQSFVGAFISADIGTAPDAAAHAGTLINDLIAASSSILFTLQQLALCSHASSVLPREHSCGRQQLAEKPAGRDVVELDAGVLLAKYTHSCHVCGKGFQRDANLRMHMRAHGDEYKTRAALAKREEGGGGSVCRKYSCPQEGCRWNARHEKFQPLKSVACAKNHYKRSHCPKLYVCSRCGAKEFAVLSDLRTHEKHCGNPRWRCTCGTTFSRKDKLMGHVKLFAYHAPVPPVEGAACN